MFNMQPMSEVTAIKTLSRPAFRARYEYDDLARTREYTKINRQVNCRPIVNLTKTN